LEDLMKYVIVVAALMSTVLALPAFADCQSDIDEVKAQVDDDKGNYTREARKEARKHLAKAENNKDDAKACRTEILDARRALQKGKR
jgi:hypothetical protein